VELEVPSRIPGDESWSDAAKRILLRNEAQLNFVSLRSCFDCVRAAKLSRVFDERPSGALDSLAARWEKCCYFLLDNADVVIEGVLKLPKRAAAASSPKRIKRTQKPRPLAVGVFIFVSTPASSIDAPVTFPLIFLLTPARAGRTIRLVSPKSSSLQPECTPLEASVYSALIWQPRKTES